MRKTHFFFSTKTRMILDHFVEGQSHKIKAKTRKSVRLNDENRQNWHKTFFKHTHITHTHTLIHSDTPEYVQREKKGNERDILLNILYSIEYTIQYI